ncbi:S8 family peptidase [Glycomyces salinus]|uniref:S8 family peptidase n=1 Tax=Glycomyces salinus TaxID=980294 RepID=UPI0018EB5B48|nr:S8/S53 family peptidase [Glycomyces salinus]
MRLVFANEEPHLEPNPGRHLMDGVPELSPIALDRHGSRVLRPGDVVRAPEQPMPVGTIYRYDRLLVDESVVGDPDARGRLSDALRPNGLKLECQSARSIVAGQGSSRVPVTLSGRGGPATVDAWAVLQSVRSAVTQGRLEDEIAAKVGLEHLLVCSKNGPSIGSPEPSPVGAHLSPLGRIPVDMVNPMPPRRLLDRRVKVAILDTGVPRQHPAFDVSDRTMREDTFVVVDHEFQEELAKHADSLAGPLKTPWEGPVHEPNLIKEIASHYGHGTFMTGLLRQMAPDVQVYSLRVVHNDGLSYEHEMIAALRHVANQVEAARGGDPQAVEADMVVVASGYVDEDPDDQPGRWLKAEVDRLTALGVPVVAAAGNQSSDRPFYPAAFAAHPQAEDSAPVVSVAALNSNRNVAMFSNDGTWVSCFATGAALVSTFPCDGKGSRMPDRQSMSSIDRHRESHDPDDFSAGYAIWSGTSFAAPVAAAYLANEMADSGVPPAAVENSVQAATWVHGALKRLKNR